MTKYGKYTFVGKDPTQQLRRGKNYELAIHKMTFFERVLGVYPFSWKVVAFRPFDPNSCLIPYECFEDFEHDWHKVDKVNTHVKLPNNLISAH
jgi:hypothetical protein